MNKSRIIWYVLGGLALVALGFASGFLINRVPIMGAVGPVGALGARRMMPFGGFGILAAGLGLLARVVFCLGPLAGIVALVIVLTRRSPTSPAPAQTAPATRETTSSAASDETATALSESTPPLPIKKKK